MKKSLTFILFFCICVHSYTQLENNGVIRFSFSDEIPFDFYCDTLKISYTNTQNNEVFTDTAYLKNDNLFFTKRLPAGKYTMHIKGKHIPYITVSNIIVLPDRISFIHPFQLNHPDNKENIELEYTQPASGYKFCG